MYLVEIFNKVSSEWENVFPEAEVIFPTRKEAQECIDLFKRQDELHEMIYPGGDFKTDYRVRKR